MNWRVARINGRIDKTPCIGLPSNPTTGREVPSNHAAAAELIALCAVLAEFGHGAIEFIPRSFVEGYNAADRELLLSLYRVSGRPIELNTLTPLPAAPDG